MNKILKFLGILVIFGFLFCYFIEYSGYYEYNLHSKKTLTEEEIKRFESDVKNGKNIDINTYFTNNTTDYSNNLTKTAVKPAPQLNFQFYEVTTCANCNYYDEELLGTLYVDCCPA